MIDFHLCDFTNETHRQAAISLLCHYMSDPMGDAQPLSPALQQQLVEQMTSHQHAAIMLMRYQGEYAGLCTSFELVSTFKAKPYLYIHDVIVDNRVRGKGLGRALMEKMVEFARSKGCCKVTLEVREDNHAALKLYSDLGFEDCDPRMYFWTKLLE